MRITRPETFVAAESLVAPASLAVSDLPVPPASAPVSRLSLIPKFPNLGIMGMTELLTALSLLGGIDDATGKRPATVALAEAFEQAFGFTFGNIYDRQGELFKRKAYNITKTLDALKGVLMKEFRRRGSGK